MTEITVQIVFNQETDRYDWLDRCCTSIVESGAKYAVHSYPKSAPYRQRVFDIAQRFVDTGNWLVFADPDDVVIPSGFRRFVRSLQTTKYDCMYAWELTVGATWQAVRKVIHHPIAMRGAALQAWVDQSREENGALKWRPVTLATEVPIAAYIWYSWHGSNTRGLPPPTKAQVR